MSEDLKDVAASVLIVFVLLFLFLGLPILMGLYLQLWVIFGLYVLWFSILVILPTDDTEILVMLLRTGLVFWAIVGITYYISTDQTFIGDFWNEHKHWIIR